MSRGVTARSEGDISGGPGKGSLLPCACTSQTPTSFASAERQPEPGLVPVKTCQQEALVRSLAWKRAQANVVMSLAAASLREGTENLSPTLGLNEYDEFTALSPVALTQAGSSLGAPVSLFTK